VEAGSSTSTVGLRVMRVDKGVSLESERARNCQTVVEVWSWAPDGCFVSGWTGRLTIGCNMGHESTSSYLCSNKYERKKWRHCWGQCFVFGPLRIYASSDSRLALQGVEEGSNQLYLSPASRKRQRKGSPLPVGITGPPYSWGIYIRGPGLQVLGISNLRQ
jgi:hypothetical protein